MAANITDVPRSDKRDIARNLIIGLKGRLQGGDPEPSLDAFIPELEQIAAKLDTHVSGNQLADAARAARLERADVADVNVDTWLRHIESYIDVEAKRRAGPNVARARGLYAAACPDGLAHVDARIVDENAHCRETLGVLKAPEHAAAIAAIELPNAWITKFEAALVESEAAINDVIAARGEKSTHVALGQNVEDEWVDLMVRLRKYMGSRAKRTDYVKVAESRALLSPLLDALQKMRVDAASRATKRTVKLPKPSAAPAEPPASQANP